MSIKTSRAKKHAVCGRYHRTWNNIIARIPSDVIASITSKQLACLADAMWHQYNAGFNNGYNTINE